MSFKKITNSEGVTDDEYLVNPFISGQRCQNRLEVLEVQVKINSLVSLQHSSTCIIVNFAKKLQQITGNNIPVLGSFSIAHNSRESFYEEYSNLFKTYSNQGVNIIPQWLPPIAWYHGGSVKLNVMNEKIDIKFINKYDLGLCLDICHIILGRNYFNFLTGYIIDSLDSQIQHIHIADASGIDGEGLPIGTGDAENLSLIKRSMNFDCLKVIEVWQGHLNNGEGFRSAITKLVELYEKD